MAKFTKKIIPSTHPQNRCERELDGLDAWDTFMVWTGWVGRSRFDCSEAFHYGFGLTVSCFLPGLPPFGALSSAFSLLLGTFVFFLFGT